MSSGNKFPESWTTATLGMVCSNPQYGWTTPANKTAGTVKLLRTSDITDGAVDWSSVPYCSEIPEELSKYQLAPDDIVISRAGSVGASFLVRDVPEKVVFASYLIRFRPISPINPSYVAHFLQTSSYWSSITDKSAGIAVPNVNARKLETIELPLAPATEQERIVSKIEELFSDLDAGVAALERARANLKRYRAAVLKAAIEGKLTEQWRKEHPNVEPASKLLERILAERRKKWEEAQLAKYAAAGKTPPKGWKDKYPEPAKPDTANLPGLPKGWCWATMEQIGEVQLGRQRSPKNRSKDYPTRYLRAANITEMGLDLSDVLDMEFKPNEKENYLLRYGDLILSEASGSPNQVGKPAIWRNELDECCFQNTVIRLRSTVVDLSVYLLNVLRAYYINGVFAKTATGVGINHLSAYKFARLPLPLAPLVEQAEVISQIEAVFSTIAYSELGIERSHERATRLRQSILKRAFEGKLVPQDPNDEPASVLLERIRAARAAQNPPRARKRRQAAT